jgi:SAM-dependent methyltransferase
MAGGTPIFDRALIRRRLARAAALGPADFLLRRAAEDLEDRLGAVLRDFPVAVDLQTPGPAAAAILAASPRVGRVVRLAGAPGLLGRGGWTSVVADEEVLPLRPESVDLVVSLLALQAVDDLPGVMLQVRRALRPDGLFLACLLGGRSLAELREAFAVAETEVEGGISPRVAPFADLRDLGALLQRAGFALPVTDIDSVTVRYPDPFALMHDLRAMGATNPLFARRRQALRRATLVRAAEVLQERFSDPDGRIRATFELVWLSGWAPHENQQKPLRPGSAKTRLADALRTAERSAGEKPGG